MAAKLLFERGNLFTGHPYGVLIVGPFGSSELHGPFSTENEAWNWGIEAARESNGTLDFKLVQIETPIVKTIATAEEVRAHIQRTADRCG